MIWICFQVSWSCMLAPRKSMQADLHGARSPYVLIICSLPVVFVCNALFLFLLHCTNPKQSLLMSARSSSHYERFLVTPSMCCVFICTNSRHTREALLSEAGFEKCSGPRIGSVGRSCFVDDFVSCAECIYFALSIMWVLFRASRTCTEVVFALG